MVIMSRLALAFVLFAALDASARAEAPRAWHVFLIAADRSEPVFDNAVDRLAALFKQRYGIVAEKFTSQPLSAGGKHDATWQDIRRVALEHRMARGDACLFYFTSHGDEGGLYMARHRSLLPPEYLARLLDRVCGKRPTVVVVSACHSGTFLRPALTTDNRVILTAARADRSSFGCSFKEQLAIYDRCFLDSWGASPTWTTLHAAVAGCVRAAEQQRRYRPPSEPQAFFGRLVKALPLNLRRRS
jgi:Peptidase C13 family